MAVQQAVLLPLTEQQREYLRLALHGYTDGQIAAGCGVSFSAVRRQLEAAYRQLGVTRAGNARTAAALRLYREEFSR